MRKVCVAPAALLGVLLYGQALAAEGSLAVETQPHFVKDEKFGRVLVGANDLALYTFKKDQVKGAYPPKCTTAKDDMPLGSCLQRWPAATISYDNFSRLLKDNPDHPYGLVFNKEVNGLQLTYEGLPLYYWFGDKRENNTNFTGVGVYEAWNVISMDKIISYEGHVKNK